LATSNKSGHCSEREALGELTVGANATNPTIVPNSPKRRFLHHPAANFRLVMLLSGRSVFHPVSREGDAPSVPKQNLAKELKKNAAS
jgi:hypothetical protein